MLLSNLNKYKYISFDIFDTLIVRNCLRHTDVFQLTENIYNLNHKNQITNFKSNRILAEKLALNSTNDEEVTLNDIYYQLKKFYDDNVLTILKNIEIDVEINICDVNKECFNIYKYCIENNYKVIITSDMYLSKKIIESILKKNGINQYEKIFISSECKKTKRSGSIFKYINNILHVTNNDIIHIGNDKKSDYLNPKKNGWDCIFISNKNDRKIKTNKSLSYQMLSKFIYNNMLEKDFFSTFGYKNFGPLLFGFTQWLITDLKQRKIEKVFFFSRDGYILKQAFDLLNTDDSIKSYYFYASRRALIVPSLFKYKNIEEILTKMYLPRKISLDNLLKKFGLDDVNLESYYKKYNIENDSKYIIETQKISENIIDFLNDIYPIIVKNSKKEYASFFKYIKNVEFEGKVAIVDIGWFGNMQFALEKMIDNVEIKGYYVGINPDNKYQDLLNMKGFLFDKYTNYNNYLHIHRFNSIFEFLFLAQHGSVKKYNDMNKLMVDFYDYEYSDLIEKEYASNIQSGALEFIKNLQEKNFNQILLLSENDAIINLVDFAENPTALQAKKFGNISFLDDGIQYIARPKKFFFYVFHIKQFINDYIDSQWRIGFLKRIFKSGFLSKHLSISLEYIAKKYIKKESTKNES